VHARFAHARQAAQPARDPLRIDIDAADGHGPIMAPKDAEMAVVDPVELAGRGDSGCGLIGALGGFGFGLCPSIGAIRLLARADRTQAVAIALPQRQQAVVGVGVIAPADPGSLGRAVDLHQAGQGLGHQRSGERVRAGCSRGHTPGRRRQVLGLRRDQAPKIRKGDDQAASGKALRQPAREPAARVDDLDGEQRWQQDSEQKAIDVMAGHQPNDAVHVGELLRPQLGFARQACARVHESRGLASGPGGAKGHCGIVLRQGRTNDRHPVRQRAAD
jgi:hypothetical protein